MVAQGAWSVVTRLFQSSGLALLDDLAGNLRDEATVVRAARRRDPRTPRAAVASVRPRQWSTAEQREQLPHPQYRRRLRATAVVAQATNDMFQGSCTTEHSPDRMRY